MLIISITYNIVVAGRMKKAASQKCISQAEKGMKVKRANETESREWILLRDYIESLGATEESLLRVSPSFSLNPQRNMVYSNIPVHVSNSPARPPPTSP